MLHKNVGIQNNFCTFAKMIKRNTLFKRVRLLMQLMVLAFWEISVNSANIQRINPYDTILKMLLKEPPVGVATNISTHNREYVQEMWLPQKVDHFAGTEHKLGNQTWMMRYYVNAEFYEPGGPILILVGGEWEITPSLLHQGHFYDMALQHNGIMFYTEHRYYGKSWPISSVSVDSLKYLSVLQSLEDLRYFIEYQKSYSDDLRDAKVVLVGCSYSGSMVAWFMKLYPNEANVAWASSAPLLAKIDFTDYMSLTMKAIREIGGSKCANNLESGFQKLRLQLQSPTKSRQLLQRLQSCKSFNANNEMDRAAFFNSLGNYFAVLVQSYSKWVGTFCKNFLKMTEDPGEALIQHIEEIFLPNPQEEEEDKLHGDEWCLDLSYEAMASIYSEYADIYSGTRCWFYQTCHEFGWFATTKASGNASSQLSFAGQVPLKFFQNLCHDVFHSASNGDGSRVGGSDLGLFSPLLNELHISAKKINHIFGGFANVSQRVIFTHGLLDPWRAVGVHRGQNVLLLKGYSHVEDLGSINLKDTVEMNVAKLKVAAFINKALRN